VLIAALIAIAAGMLWNSGLGVYHCRQSSGSWWPGPQECSGALDDLGRRGGPEAARIDQPGALATMPAWRFSRPLARRLQRADLAQPSPLSRPGPRAREWRARPRD
jgi:hypothetical protein